MKKFFGFILFVAIAGGVVYFIMNKNNQGNDQMVYEEVNIEQTAESENAEMWDSVSTEISNGIEAVGKGIKFGFNKLKGDSSEKAASGEKGLFEKIGDKFKSRKESVEKTISTHETSAITGKLVVKGKGEKMKCYVKTGFFAKTRVKVL